MFWLIQWLTGIALAGYVLAAVFLFFLEKLKRKSSNEFFQETVELTTWTFIGITILIEIFFEACIVYIWFFYYRSYVERKKISGMPGNESQKLSGSSSPLSYSATNC